MIKESMLFLYFNGNCRQALTFYCDSFEAKLMEMITYGEAEMADGEEQKDLIMNSTLEIGGMKFCASDVVTDNVKEGNNLSVWLEFDEKSSFERAYSTCQESNCNVISPQKETFWNSIYAKIQDPFGIIWELNYQK